MKLKELLDLGLVHDNVRVVVFGDDPDLNYQFRTTGVFSRALSQFDLKPNKTVKNPVELKELLNREVVCVAGAKQPYCSLIVVKKA